MTDAPAADHRGGTGGYHRVGVLFFALNDTMGRWLLDTCAVGQLMLVRSISGLRVMVPAIRTKRL